MEPELDYTPVLHENFNRNTPKPGRNTTVTSIQSSPQVSNRSIPFSPHSALNSPLPNTPRRPNSHKTSSRRSQYSPNTTQTLSSLRTANSPSHVTSPLSSPTHTAISPPHLATPNRESRSDFFARLSKGGRRQPTRASPQKTRSFISNLTGNGFISKKRWLFT